MLRNVGAAVALQIAVCTTAWACDGQAGKVIFEDTFTDDSGGWDLTPLLAVITPPDFLFSPNSKSIGVQSQNLTFRATDADFCMEAVLPKSIAADNTLNVGIEFWATDYNNLMLVIVSSAGSVILFSKAGTWQTIFTVPNAPGFKADADAVNALRVVTKGGKITVYLNGTLVKAVRAQVPDGNLRFGLYGQIDKPADAVPVIRVKSYKVTAGQ